MTTPVRRAARRAAIAYVIATACVGLAMTVFPDSGWQRQVASDVLLLLLPMTVALCWGAYLTLRIRGSVEHRLWGLFVIAAAALIVAEGYWTWYTISTGDAAGPAVPWVSFAGYAVALGCFYRLVVDMTAYGRSAPLERMRFLADVLGAVAALVPTLYIVWTRPMFSAIPGASDLDAYLSAMYPVVALLIAAGGIAVTVGWKAYRWRRWERYLASFFAMYAVALVLFPLWSAVRAATGMQPAWYPTLLGCAWGLLGVAAATRATEPATDATFEAWPVPDVLPVWFGRAYPVALAAAVPVLGIQVARIQSDAVAERLILASAILLSVVLAVRSIVVSLIAVTYRRAASTDPESGALDRELWIEAAQEAIARASEGGSETAVIAVSTVDPGHGASLGRGVDRAFMTAVLHTVAGVTGVPQVYALTADTFGVFVGGTDTHDASALGRRLWLAVSRDAERAQHPYDVAVGIAVVPTHATTPERLSQVVDSALAAARAAQAEPVAIFAPQAERISTQELERAARLRGVRATARRLAEAVDARHESTAEHSANVSELATALAQVFGLADEAVQVIGLSALMHDVGKVGVRDDVLSKPGPLTAEERREVEQHPLLSESILAPTGIDGLLPIVRGHHERWDGQGYPDGLAGPAIPLGARVLAVCDSFVSLTTRKAYRDPASVPAALDEIESAAGTQFDPEIASTFVRMVRSLESGSASSPLRPSGMSVEP